MSSCQTGTKGEIDSLKTKTESLEEATALFTVRHDIFSAFRDWQKLQKGYSGTLLYYYQTDGPFTEKLYDMYDGRIPLRIPESWTLACLKCADDRNCTAIMTVKFNTEEEDKLMKYEFVNTGFFSPYSEIHLTPSEETLTETAHCKTENTRMFESYIQSQNLNVKME